MASSCEASYISDPNFAVICAFLERFASSCGIKFPTFVDLQEMLENVDQVPQELIDLHIKLLRKARKTVFIEKWERALIKFCHTYSSQDGWEIERFGYKKSRLEVKIRVLKMLLEGQFDLNQKFKAQINTQESRELRTKPLGKDKLGRLYWLQTDPVSNIRVYREDMDEESWTLVAKDRPTLVELLQELSGEESPLDLNLLNEDSASLDVDKPITDTGQDENGSIKGDDEVDNEKVGVNGEMKGNSEKAVNNASEKETVNGEFEKKVINSDSEKEAMIGDFDKDVVNDRVIEELEVGEVIEDPVMYVIGEGAGADCEAGNPDKEEEQNEHVEESAPNTSEHDLPGEKQKPTPKLWSIDTICGVNSTEVNEVKHKNFSSFSIDSVLEKKDSDATFSKYTVNCPIESNSIEEEEPSDVNLKTEINSDAVPYQDASVSELEVCTPSMDINKIESNSENAGDMDSSLVRPNAEMPLASNQLDTDNSKSLEGTTEKTAKSNIQETAIEIESSIGEEIEEAALIMSTSTNKTDKLKNDVENKMEQVITSPLEPEVKPTVDEQTDFFNDNDSVLDNELEKVTENQELKNESQTMPEEQTFEKVNETLKEIEAETVLEVPKLLEEKMEVGQLNILEVSENIEKKNESAADTKKENQLVINERKIFTSELFFESAKVQEMTKTEDAEEPKQMDLNETTATQEELEQIKETNTTEETKILENTAQKITLEDVESIKSKTEEVEITGEEALGEISEDKETEKTDITVTETKLEEPEINDEVVRQPTQKEQEPLEVDLGPETETANEKLSKEDSANVEEKVREIVTEQSLLKNDEEEKNKDNERTKNVKIELTENLEGKKEEKQPQEVLDEKEKESAVIEVELKSNALEESATKEDESDEEKLIEEELSKNVKPEKEKVEKANEEMLTDECDEIKQGENKKETTKTKETAEIKESSETKDIEDKKIKRELVVTIEKMETVPEIKKEDENEKFVEEDKKLTRSSTKTAEEEMEKSDEKEGEEEGVVESKKEKQEARRLSRNRRGVEETTKIEETPRMTRGMRKSVGLEETPKQAKAKKGRKKAKEEEEEENDIEMKEELGNVVEMKEKEENDVEMKEEIDETAKEEDEKSEEEEDEEKEKDKGPQKPQGRRGRRRRRRRVFTLTRRKVQEVNDKEDEKKDIEKEDNKEVEKKPEGEKNKENKENQEKKERKRRRKRDEATLLRERAAQELKLLGATEDSETPTIRQSRRIAQIKLKEEAERRRLEALQLESFKKEKDKKGKKKKKSKHDSDSGDEDKKDKDDDEDSDDEMTKKEKKRRKKKDKLKFNELNPWLSSTESSTVDEDEEELEDEPHEDDELVFKSDHEFSPESDMEDPDYKPIKRARTAKVEESEEKGGKYDDTACEKCGNKDHPEWILLCDKCDKGWHASCVRPALMVVPEGDWFCPPCEHIFLIEKLKQSLAQYDRTQKQRENEELRRKRLAFVGISLDNVLPPAKKIPKDDKEEDDDEDKSASESSSESESSQSDSGSGSSDSAEPVYQLRERRANVTSYRYNEYDELIKSALKDEIEAVKGAGNAGRGKDINNIVNAEKQNENENSEDKMEVSEKEEDGTTEEKPKQKNKKEDGDYEAETEEEDEEDENVVDEIPPVVPKNTGLKKKKSKSVKITSLDFTSEEEDDNNSDSDFKGTSDEEESECSLPSESESSEEIGRRRKGYDGPVRRSTRARVSRYDRDFINDDTEDDEPKRKRRRSWESSESSDSDRSWGKKKRKKGGSTSRAKRFPSEKKKKKRQKKRSLNSDDDEEHRPPKKYKSRKVIYGGLDEEPVLTRRTRGKKINYQEMNGSDSEDDQPRKTSSRVIESDDDFVAENDKDEEQNVESEEIESGVDEDEDTDGEKEKKPIEKKKKILEKIKKKKWVIPDPDDFSENDLMEEKQLDELNEELEDLDKEEEEILGNILEKGDVPINELRDAVKRAKEEKKKKKETEKSDPEALPRTFPPIPAHMEFGSGKFPKIGKVKITPSRAELASMGGLPSQGTLPGAGVQPGLVPIGYPTPEKQEDKPVIPLRPIQNEKGLGDLNIPAKHSKLEQRLYPYQMEAPSPAGPLTMMAMMNSQQSGDAPIGAKNGPPLYPYQGMGEYPPNIPTTVMGISDIEAQGKKKPGPKPGTKMKKKIDDPSLKDGDDNAGSGDEFKMEGVKGVRKGKKPEGEGVSTVQPPTQFPPAESGSVITRMLNSPQYESNQFGLRNPPFRPIHFATPPRPPPPIRVRVPGPMFHTSHPHDPSPSGGGPINIQSTKPSPPSPTFNRGQIPVLQRFPDPRFALQSAPPSRPEFSSYSGFYGNYPQPEEASFQNPPPSYPEQFAEGAPPPPKSFDDETGGEFGGLASYFASQREEDLDT